MKDQQKPVRVRFAPSPTGHLHIGGLRAALFNWLFARHYDGVFLLRIEDTDRDRSSQEYTDAIIDTFAWMGITPDEPIVIQSERLKEHRRVAQKLLDEDKAYYCSCTQEEVLARHVANGGDPLFVKYDGHCRYHNVDQNRSLAIRFAIPESVEEITFDDLIRGPITFHRSDLDDFIIVRSDGTPMYNFVVVVDDAVMEISHVIRGEDHISNTPKQILLYEACGYSLPFFAHAPNILGPSGKKLSKREAATSVLDYRRSGYLPAALCNYLVRLGWSHGDQEVFSEQELVDCFTLEAVGRKGSIFDQEKLDWLNGVYIRASEGSDLLARVEADVAPDIRSRLSQWSEARIIEAIILYQDRVKTLMDSVRFLDQLYRGLSNEQFFDHPFKADIVLVRERLQKVCTALEHVDHFSPENIKSTLTNLAKLQSIPLVSIAQPVRYVLTGYSDGPGLFALLVFLGKDESLNRIKKGIHTLSS